MTYIDTAPSALDPGFSWAEHTRQRLLWLYGPRRTQLIINGQDPRSEADRRAWKALGTPRHER